MIRFCAFFLLLAFAASCSSRRPTSDSAAMGVLQRVLGMEGASHFNLTLIPARERILKAPKHSSTDTFTISASRGVVSVSGTSPVALTSGAYWYLKHVAKCQMTWGENSTGNQFRLPSPLPDAPTTTISTSVPWRYAWNVVTFQYTATWWQWDRWQQEIDWLAMHGNNLPLALVGLEYVWWKVYEKLGVELSDLQSWFTGPAFLAWQRMGNIRGFAGPLSQNWLEQQYQLQLKIVAAMESLGMVPVLPCFSGHVPKITEKIFPNASYHQSPPWNGFPSSMTDVYLVDPTDPLFVKLGTMYMQEMTNLYGSSHFYSCDTFNEVDPTSTDPTYLKAAGSSVIQSIQAVDPEGVWVMQAWLFRFGFWSNFPSRVEAYLSGIPEDSLLILDLCSEAGPLATQYNNYYGKHWVWNLLHNYGGVRGMYGNLSDVATSPMQWLNADGSTMVGIGFTPESILQNPVMYELLTDTFFSSQPISVSNWLGDYVTQRYGAPSTEALRAWGLLRQAVYNQPGEARSEIEHIPTSGLEEQPDFGWQYGDATIMFSAWEQFQKAARSNEVPNVTTNGPFQYDFVDVTRQSMTMFFSDVHRLFCSVVAGMSEGSFSTNNTQLWAIGNQMLRIIQSLDDLLGTNPNYLLGVWLKRANAKASSSTEEALFDFNAKNQITMWGPDAQITDYAAKAWQGLYGSYYYSRWKLFFNTLIDGGIDQWDRYNFDVSLLQFETSWCHNTSQQFSPVPSGKSAVAVADILHGLATGNLSSYDIFQNEDQTGDDYSFTPMWTNDPRQLAALCDLTPTCTGFNTAGYLKTATGPRTSYNGVDFYQKKTA